MNDKAIFGDSHVMCFEKIKDINAHVISTATAQGLTNENAKSQAGEKIKALIKEKGYKNIYLHFGKVDLDYVTFYKQANGKKITFKEQIEISTDALIEFANSLDDVNVTFVGVHLPLLNVEESLHRAKMDQTITNVSLHAGIDKPDKVEVFMPTLERRTLYGILYNKKLQEKAYSNGHKYIDIVDELLDFETGKIFPRFKISKTNRHCNIKMVGEIYERKYFN